MSVASPSRAAFPGSQAGRHPRLHFRGLLRLHSNYGPLDRSTAQGGLCHRASIHPVTRTNRLPATRSNRQLSGWFLPPLVIRAFWAHCGLWACSLVVPICLHCSKLRKVRVCFVALGFRPSVTTPILKELFIGGKRALSFDEVFNCPIDAPDVRGVAAPGLVASDAPFLLHEDLHVIKRQRNVAQGLKRVYCIRNAVTI